MIRSLKMIAVMQRPAMPHGRYFVKELSEELSEELLEELSEELSEELLEELVSFLIRRLLWSSFPHATLPGFFGFSLTD